MNQLKVQYIWSKIKTSITLMHWLCFLIWFKFRSKTWIWMFCKIFFSFFSFQSENYYKTSCGNIPSSSTNEILIENLDQSFLPMIFHRRPISKILFENFSWTSSPVFHRLISKLLIQNSKVHRNMPLFKFIHRKS